MLDGIDHVPWHLEIQPSSNALDEVPQALCALAEATPADSQAVYSRVLYAVGNNHAGTYFPVAVSVVPFLGEILREADVTARLRTLDVLIDLIGSFEPEAGFETIETADGPRPLRTILARKIAELAPDVARRVVDAGSPEEAKLGKELLALIQDDASDR